MPLIKTPGFIDVHVHLREPGATDKEDFHTGSRSAITGGFVHVLDMPNNSVPTITLERLEEKIKLADEKAICDIGFHFGTDGKNMSEFAKVWDNPRVYGLKIYCNHTTGDMLVHDEAVLENIFSAWSSDKPILVHAEGEELIVAIALAEKFFRKLHVCHVSTANEVEMVRQAKQKGLKISAGVTPHHLYLTDDDVARLGGYAIMKPALGSQADQDALWAGIQDGTIDLIETDHAPHTKEEKNSENPPFGVTGLETAVGLMYKAVHDGKISLDDVQKLLHTNPKKIFNMPDMPDTYIELDPDLAYVVPESGFETKCDWSPYSGMTLYGKPETVVIGGRKILEKGKIIV